MAAAFPADPGAYAPPLSLWRLVEQHVPLGEQDEIKSMLGESLVDQTLELHDEINLLLDIWHDYREETENEQRPVRPLAEPPHVRERLIQEICFLADSVREKSQRKGVDLPAVLSRHNSQVLDYVEETRSMSSGRGSPRPMTARSSDGRQTPLSPSGQAESRRSLSSTISDDVLSANKKLNYLEFSEVCQKLKDTLLQEMEQLESDIAFLHGCLDSEANFRSSGTPALSREPTLTELREERSLLEKELLSSDVLPNAPPINKPAFKPGAAPPSIKMQNLGPAVTSRKPGLTQTSSPTGSAKVRAMPLKASHNIGVAAGLPDSLAISVLSSRGSSPHESSSSSSGELSVNWPSDTDLVEKNLSSNNTGEPGHSADRHMHSEEGQASFAKQMQSKMHAGSSRHAAEAQGQTRSEGRMGSARFAVADIREISARSAQISAQVSSPPAVSSVLGTSPSLSVASSSHSTASLTPSPPNHSRSGSENEDGTRHRSSSGARRRTVSPGRVKVVPVGSIIDPRVGAGDGGHFIPTPPPSDKPPLNRPNSAERFRKFVLQCRDGN